MKTHVFNQSPPSKPFHLIIILFALFSYSSTQAQVDATSEASTQTLSINGIVNDSKGPLDSVNVIQKGTRNGTVTNTKGEFKFPNELKTGDILIFSYLGYKKQEIEITDSTPTYLKIVLKVSDIEMIGALATEKPYKSKRKN